MRVTVLLLVVASAAMPELAAQQQTSDPIPRELAVALLDRYGMTQRPADIVVGRLPSSFPVDAILRDDIKVMGGVEAHGSSTVVATVPEQPERALARVAAHLEQAGWRRAEEHRMAGGFVPSATARPPVFCRGDAVLAYTAREREGVAGSRLHLTVSHPEGYSQCSPAEDRGGRRRASFRYPDLPNLEAPAGARILGAGQGGTGPGSREASARLETTQSAAAVAGHFAEQLRRAGWTLSSPTQGESVVVYRAQRDDEDKRPLSGALIILAVPGSQQLDVVFRFVRVEMVPR